MEGKALTGEGTEPAAGGAGGEDAPEEGFKEADDIAEIHASIDAFKEIGEQLQKDLGEHGKKMARAFVVMVLNAKYSPATGKTTRKFENYRVLVGPQASIDAVNNACKEKIKGSFEVVERFQAI